MVVSKFIVPHSLEFTHKESYPSREIGVTLSIQLQCGLESVTIHAKVDTGAQNCIFQREYADILGLELESGVRQEFSTVVGGFTAFGHEITITACGMEVHAMAYFAENGDYRLNVLGLMGWLDRFHIALDHYNATLYLRYAGDQ